MKKITLLLLLFTSLTYAQIYTTGTVPLTGNFSVEFEVNNTTNQVTMTMIGPSDRWLAVAPGISTGSSMGSNGDDVIVYNSNGLQDRHMTGSNGTPNLDSNNNWSVVSDVVSNGIRTVVANRAQNSGDSDDFVFPSTQTMFPILWAYGNSLSFSYHASRGGAQGNLSTSGFDLVDFDIYPNPFQSEFTVNFPTAFSDVEISVFDVLGKTVYQSSLSRFDPVVSTQDWNSGIYVIQISTNDAVSIKRIVKQ